MIDPVIFSFHVGSFNVALRWYGVLVMLGVIVGVWVAEKEITRRGEKGQTLLDAMIWILPAAIMGARLWYVINATLGGNSYYLENPTQIIHIPQGGLHIYGGLLLVGIAMWLFLRRHHGDVWLFLDSIASTVLPILSTRHCTDSQPPYPGAFPSTHNIVLGSSRTWSNILLKPPGFTQPLPMKCFGTFSKFPSSRTVHNVFRIN